ncbi:MAG: efflux RND transporter periplasmic adaptor subunit [Candidatus Aureabacteria bacterium]|nr:efflux RND transporter periplasmic adaptor subunit [Candidatus Auribacterota bacterium]
MHLKKGRLLWIIALAVVLILVFKSCSKKKPVPQVHPRPVRMVAAVEKDIPVYINSFGTINSYYDVNIQARVTGEVMAAHFKEGDDVKQGDLLFSIDVRPYEAELEKAQATLAEDLVDLKLKQDTLERNRKLMEKNLISKQDFETYQSNAAAAEAKVSLDRAAVDQAKLNVEFCSICAPINGVTGKRLVDPGNIVSANTGPTLVNIRMIDPIFIDFTISEKDFPEVHKQMKQGTLGVTVKPAGDEKTYEGKLTLVNNAVDPQTGMILLRAEIPNSDKTLWPGQYATIRLVVRTEKDAVLVPVTAVQFGQKGMYMYIVTDKNTAELRDNIVVGLQQDDNLVIEKGVSPGEKVVTYGQLGLRDGIPVMDLDSQSAVEGSAPGAAKGKDKKKKASAGK